MSASPPLAGVGAASYSSFTWGLAQVLFAIVIVWTARVTRPVGYLMGLSGLAIIVAGWVIGTQGFGFIANVPATAGYAFLLASSIWLYIVAWLRKESVQAAGR